LRGVVSAASYEARRHGIHSAMPILTAKKLCPMGIFLPVRMQRYQEISTKIMAIFRRFTPLVEPLSLDEAFLDVTGCSQLFGDGVTIAQKIRLTIKEEIGLTVSAGIATSKLLAKIASDINKPDGLTIVPPGTEKEFLAPLPINKLWGVGKTTADSLHHIGIQTIGGLTRLPLQYLEEKYGKQGRHLYFACRAIDNRRIVSNRPVKSLGNEETFENDLVALKDMKRVLLALANQVGHRLRAHKLSGQTISLKVKYYDFQCQSKAKTLSRATNDQRIIFTNACSLLQNTKADMKAVRLLGITISNLKQPSSRQQLNLFSDPSEEKQSRLNEAMDMITGRHGRLSLRPAACMEEEEVQNKKRAKQKKTKRPGTMRQ